jgi:hypothetical protein
VCITRCVPSCRDCSHCQVNWDDGAHQRMFLCRSTGLATKEARDGNTCGKDGRLYRSRNGVDRLKYRARMLFTSRHFVAVWWSARIVLSMWMWYHLFLMGVFFLMMCCM